ncbi:MULTISPECIES: MFS transporter [unclassified Microcoleus]|uniref:MFS transporter n=1 Tax=unclassified Microcoleus TaxID=2642155 RepID=UPI001DFCF379|nr:MULTISPECIES: MFS transporter [unclassified Microcoleus]MCC3444473.1 MFS transporter [Microcoleus sp. PH2017_03_ELD_O_A]MCC3505022.1 MFS transporter [Microcoleus sp. PH2017_19_SFW_U_A]MCC3512856.1 MFS transporter [Microcoleus sp. PH2017_17_BER_D_A]TAE40085.1 MAG: MFS transporter [Oscillatoriales cyanobacterium]MCC3521811.1 MFS transporter [Microcoleus sp. PH2017_20_SFW_D_A]
MNLLAKIKKIKLPPALRSQNYRLFFAGQGISLIGSWMTQVATVWLVYNLSDSPWMLGVVGFTSQIPTLILLPFAGVLIDRTNRHRVIIATQILAMVQSLALAFLALTGVINIWQILILSFCQGAINAFDAPARQAFVSELVEKKEDLANAIALNASMFNGARLIGPAIAGLVIGTVGPSYCFLLDGISYIAVIAGLLAMKIKPRKIAASNTKPLQRLKEGFDYAFGFPPIRAILLLLALVSFAGMSHTVLVPIFATKILNGGPQTLGFLMAASGVGAFAGAIYLIGRKSIVGIGKLIAISPAIMGFGLIGFGLSRILWLSLIMMLFVGFGFIIQFAGGNTFLQTIVEDDKRGRVMSIYTMAFFGVTPFGNLVAGGMANYIGSPNTVILGGIICILGSIIFTRQLPALKNLVRPLYQKMGLIS